MLSRQHLLLGGGARPTPKYDYFADTGGTVTWYGDSHPPAAYFADTNTTWFSWEASFGNKRYAQIRTYNHTTAVWSPVYFCGINSTLSDDDHGNPSIVRDSEGYVYVFYGSHALDNSSAHWAVTTSPNDPSAWTEKTALTGYYTYPNCQQIGTALYLFYRGGPTGGLADQDKYGVYVATAVTGGAPSWTAFKSLVQFGSPWRFYSGKHLIIGGEIYICAARAETDNLYRQDVYYFVYNPTTGAVRNLANTVTVASGSLPIDLTTANASFRIVDQATGSRYGAIPSQCVDSNGNIHITYLDGPAATPPADGPYTLQHIVWNGSSLSSPVQVGAFDTNNAQHKYDRQCCVPLPGGEIDIYWITASSQGYQWGGDVSKKRRSSAGVLGSQVLIRAAGDTYPLNNVTAVTDGHADARVIFGEQVVLADWPGTESGRLKGFAYGDGGYLSRTVPLSERGFDPAATFGANLVAWWDLQSEGRLCADSTQTMNWMDRAASRLMSQATAANKPSFSRTGWDGTLPALTGDGAATNGDILTATGPYATTQSIFVVAERGTQNTSAVSSSRPVYQTALSSGGGLVLASVLRSGADAGQTIYQVAGANTGAVASVAADGFASGAKAILFAKAVDNDLRGSVNGGAEGAAGDVGTDTATVTGIFGHNPSAERRFAGKIAEVIIINRALTTLEKQKVEGYLAWKWGIQSTLVSGHPYKSARP